MVAVDPAPSHGRKNIGLAGVLVLYVGGRFHGSGAGSIELALPQSYLCVGKSVGYPWCCILCLYLNEYVLVRWGINYRLIHMANYQITPQPFHACYLFLSDL